MAGPYPGVFNVTDPSFECALTPGGDPTTNTENLNTWVQILCSPTGPTKGLGGTLQFPAYEASYSFNGPINVGLIDGTVYPQSIIFEGTGQGTILTPLLLMTVSGNLFTVTTAAMHADNNIGGIVFEDLQIAYASGLADGAAILVTNTAAGSGSQNIRIIRMTFQDCPQGVVFENTLEGLVDQCQFTFSSNLSSSAPGIAITIDTANTGQANTQCNQILVRKCNIRISGSALPNTWTGVAVYACEHVTIQNTRISGLNNGILLSPTATAQNDTSVVTIHDCEIGTPSAGLSLTPASSAGSKLREVRVIATSFSQSPKDPTYSGAGISISLPSGGANTLIDTVKLIGVTSQGWSGSGLLIGGGQNIQIIGGSYAGNGSRYAGIVISGAPASISLVGVDMSAKYPGDSVQQNALTVAGSPTTILTKSCTMLGYSVPPVQISGAQSTLAIVDVAGYNDQNTPLNGGVAPTSAISASNSTTPYFGPSIVTFSSYPSAMTVTINGQPYTMSFGSINLANPTDTIKFSSAPSAFAWIGK